MENVSQLQPALIPQVQSSSSEAPEKDADFLALRLLNKRARLRLSPAPPDLASLPGKASLFATANSKGWFAAIIRDDSAGSALALSPLADLRSALAASSTEDEQPYRPQKHVPINGPHPHILTFASNDTRILVGLVDGSVRVYSFDQLISGDNDLVQPIHVFTTSSAALLTIQPNPGDIPDLVAILRDCTNSPDSLAVELLDVQKLISSGGWIAGKSPSTTPTSISWSPKGKQLALGFQSGDIVTFSPGVTATPKFSIPHPPSANNMSVISVHWLSASSFHTIYAPPGQLAPDVEQIHYNIFLDSKSNSAQDIRFSSPYLPFPGLRPPGNFLVCLRGWDPSKVLLFIGDSTSSDIGLIGNLTGDSEGHWHNLALEETSTPSLPLDKDQNDTILLGMDVDLTSSESYHHSVASGEVLELPAHPIMYVYASDGTIIGWHVLNVSGTSYPGMLVGLNGSTPAPSVPSVPSSIVRESSSDMQTTPTVSPTTSVGVEAISLKPLTVESVELKTPSANVVRDYTARDNDSRSPSPVPVFPKVTTSSGFSSFTHGPSTGAFSNLQTTPSAFIKPASGVFGELPKNSPFFTPKAPESRPVSFFTLSATPGTPTSTPPKTGFAQPTFGTSSMPGFKSAFPSVATSTVQPAPAASGGAFSAFLSGGGGFAAFSSGGNKSFSDLLRSTGEDKLQKAEQPQATPTKSVQVLPYPTLSATPIFTPANEPPFVLPATPEREGEKPKTAETGPSGTSITLKEKAAETVPMQELSLESISSSTSSSFVNVWAAEGEVGEEGEINEAQSQAEESDEGSEVPDEEESEASEEEESEAPEGDGRVLEGSEGVPQALAKAEQQEQVQSEPKEIPLPTTPAFTRSPSTTPKAEYPKISPPPQIPLPAGFPRASPVSDIGTTSPTSPIKDTPLVPVQMPVPTLKASPQLTPPFGLVRPNNRPIRSSPLASTSLVLEGEVENPPPVSRSAPPATVAQLAPPKTPFGQWTPPPHMDPDPTLPRTPSVLSLFPAPGEKAATPATASPVLVPPEKVATSTTPPKTTPFPPLFTLPSAFPSFTPSTAMPSTWGTPSKPAEVIPPATKISQALGGGQPNPFNIKAGPLSSSPFVSPIPSVIPSPSSTPPPKMSTPEQGMQDECQVLVTTITNELEKLKQLATAASLKTAVLKKNSGISHQKADLGDSDKWVFGDIAEYGKVLVDVQADVKEIKMQRVSLRRAMKELGSNMLKVNTRREEITRFNKAKTDAEFAKMLKIRTLAPECLETQSQLRKNIRAIKDRVQKLEDHLQASKKRINEFRTGRPSIRPPSLDTVNRTFRNIDVAIDQQKQAISQLQHRMTKLEVSGDTRDQPSLSFKRPFNVTPNVATTTAAALNAEWSAQKLKRAMLAARKQPPLNTMATASPVRTSFQTPQKVTEISPDVKTPGVFALPTTPVMSFPSSLPGWMPPPSESGSHDITPSRNRGGVKHHQKPIVLKKSASPVVLTQPSPFEWKPVEPIKPASSLPFSLRPSGST